jgi:hypothetical protein
MKIAEEEKVIANRARTKEKKEEMAAEGAKIWVQLLVGTKRLKIGTGCTYCTPACTCKLIGADLDNLALHKKIKFKKDEKSVEAKLSTLQTALGREITEALEALESQRAGSA